MPTILKPVLTATPGASPTHNFGICETFSYIPVEGAGRPLYARASYITNFSDMSIHLSAGELAIGAVTIKDNNSGLNCDVVTDPDNNLNALRVITQDLDSDYDDITIGDKNGIHYATIDGPLSSLNVKVTNLSTIETRLEGQITLLDSLTALNQKEFNETQILLLSSFLITNINLSSIQTDINDQFNETQNLLDSLTSLNLKEFNETQILLQKEFDDTQTLLNSLTSQQEDKQNQIIILLHQLTANTDEIEINLDNLEINTDQVETLILNSNTLLDSLTSLQETKQNHVITLLDALTAKEYDIVLNAENFNLPIENADITFNTLTIETLLSQLTSTDYSTSSKQDSIITLLHQLTSITDSLEDNTDEIESLITDSNTLLNSLTSLNFKEFDKTQNLLLSSFIETNTNLSAIQEDINNQFDETQTFLNSLTSLQYDKQNKLITLLNDLTANADNVETILDSLTSLQHDKQNQIITLLHQLTANTDELEINTDQVESLIADTNTLLGSLTSIQETKQNNVISLLNILSAYSISIESNTNNLEPLIETSNTFLETLTSINSFIDIKQNSVITLLNVLTSKETSIQLDTSAINLNTDEIEGLIFQSNTLLNALTSKTTITDISNIETLLNVLTGIDYATSINQEQTNTLLYNITSTFLNVSTNIGDIKTSVDQTENLLFNSNSLLDSLTSINQKEFDETQKLLESLSGINYLSEQLSFIDFATTENQNTHNTFLDSLTSLQHDKQNQIITLLHQLTANTDELEINTGGIETLIGSLTSKDFATSTNQTLLLTSTEEFYGICLANLASLSSTIPRILIENNTTNNLLSTLTSVDFSTNINQEKNITLMDALTSKGEEAVLGIEKINFNTDTIKGLLTSSNTFLEILTSKDFATSIKQDEQITLLTKLTSVVVSNDVQIHTTQTLPISGFVTVTNLVTSVEVSNPISLKDVNNNNVSVTSATSSLNVNVTNSLVVTPDPGIGFPISFVPTTNFDAFGRLRVSTPLTLFDSSHRYEDNNLWCTLTSIEGSVLFNSNQGLIEMNVNDLSGSSVIRETTKVFSYQAGKSLQVMNTFVMAPSSQNLIQRVGYFGENNGIYFQLDGNTMSFVERSLVNGSPFSETIVPQSSWNGDKLDGTGQSGLKLDITKAQIQWMDVEWLGVGTARIGFIINGQFIVCHSFHHANLISSTYITTASLPLRYEIINKDVTEGPHTMKQICSTVISEGGYELRGLQQAVSIPITTPRTFATTNVYYPIISIRLKSSPDRLDAIVIPTALSILGKGNGINYNWQVRMTGITTGGDWISAADDSSIEYNITGTNYVGGRILTSGFINSSNQSSPNLDILKESLFKFQLERNNLSKTPFELTLVIATDTSNGSGIFASMDWEEISR